MALKLQWKNNNVIPNTVRIYRGDKKLDTANLPAPLVELTNGETSWVDQSAKFGSTYFYVLAVVTANDLIPTANQEILVADNRGAGPSTLLYGDDNIGYYGQVLSADFLTNLDILAVAATTSGLPSGLVQTPWHKFVRKGRVLFMPAAPFGSTTYNALYNAGLVYGMKGNGPAEASLGGLTGVDQYRPIDFKGQKYIPRLMRGFGDGLHNDFQGWNWGGEIFPDSAGIAQVNEYNDLMFGIVNFVPECQRTETFVEGNMETYVGNPGSNYSSSNDYTVPGRILCQERNTTNVNVVARMRRSWNYGSQTTAHNKSFLQALNPQSPTQTTVWVPVLELAVQSATVTLKG